jgi:enoyl-CoA hydratase/carnithine racemase
LGAHTFGKRGALEMGLSLHIVGAREDAKMIGNAQEFVTPEQADEIERRVKETNSNVPAFLKFAGADKFSTILASRYDEIDSSLKRKEQQDR